MTSAPPPAYSGAAPYVFAAYSHLDNAVVYEEIHWLQEQGYNLAYDQGISPGTSWSDAIAERIQGCNCFLFFISPHSVASEHCRRELSFAIDENRKVVAVHLERTDLPGGVRLSLNNRQAIFRYSTDSEIYRRKLLDALSHLSPITSSDPTTEPRRAQHLYLAVRASSTSAANKQAVASLVRHLSWQGGIYRARAAAQSGAPADYEITLGVVSRRRVDVRWELIQHDSGDVLWANTTGETKTAFERKQERIVEMVAVGALEKISGHERQLLSGRPIESLTFTQLMLRAEGLNYLDRQQVSERLAALTRAQQLAPESALPHAGLAALWSWQIINGVSVDPQGARAQLLKESRRALRLAENNPEVLLAVGTTYCRIGMYPSGLSLIRRAYQMAPTVAAMDRLARSLCFAGEPEEAVSLFEEILETLPAGLTFPYVRLAIALAQCGRLDDALWPSEQSTIDFPEDYYGWFVYANLLALTGKIEEAKIALEEGRRLVPNLSTQMVVDNTISTYGRTPEQRHRLTAGLLKLLTDG